MSWSPPAMVGQSACVALACLLQIAYILRLPDKADGHMQECNLLIIWCRCAASTLMYGRSLDVGRVIYNQGTCNVTVSQVQSLRDLHGIFATSLWELLHNQHSSMGYISMSQMPQNSHCMEATLGIERKELAGAIPTSDSRLSHLLECICRDLQKAGQSWKVI